ncbi:MAG: BlaI/MecI/CopY family transcriptional regulator [Gemmatimonadaceae bacterium]|jgi:predicted transcriptional regulator|nr:BlaI/MecI/CopY family transcriptional regulator [Gemmatimonadaceae bacterium]
MPSESSKDPLPSLGELEAAVLHLLWQHGTSTAEEVRARLERPLKESTVRTVLRRLEEKGYVQHETEGRTFRFFAATPAERVAERGVRGLANWLYQGSVADLLVGFVGSDDLKPAELDRLAELIDRARRKRT